MEILFRNGDLTLSLAGRWRPLRSEMRVRGLGGARAGVDARLRRCEGGVCWRPVIGLPSQSVVVGGLGRCVGVRWWAGGGVGVLQTGPVASDVRVYRSVGHF